MFCVVWFQDGCVKKGFAIVVFNKELDRTVELDLSSQVAGIEIFFEKLNFAYVEIINATFEVT